MEQENAKKVLVFKIILFEAGPTNSHILEQDSCHWQSICYRAILSFKISLRDVNSKQGFPE